jgi:nucleoside-diphosphate-sugar epimerase
MSRALVIGSEGNIGTPLVAHLRSRGYDVLETDIKPGWREGYLMADINHPVDLLPAFDWKPDVVLLLSAMVSRVTCEQAGGLAVSTNLAGTNNVLQLTKRANAHMVYFSTSEIYGPGKDPMDEADPDPQPNNRYGLTKLLGEKLVEYEVRSHGLSAVSLRPFMMYDENEAFGDHRSAMIRFAGNLAQGKPIQVHRGTARSWLHVSDAVHAIEAAVRVKEYSVINIGHPDVVPIDKMAEMVRRELGADEKLITYTDLPARMTGIKRPIIERQRKILGVEPKVGLEEGVRRVCRRVQERMKNGELRAS